MLESVNNSHKLPAQLAKTVLLTRVTSHHNSSNTALLLAYASNQFRVEIAASINNAPLNSVMEATVSIEKM